MGRREKCLPTETEDPNDEQMALDGHLQPPDCWHQEADDHQVEQEHQDGLVELEVLQHGIVEALVVRERFVPCGADGPALQDQRQLAGHGHNGHQCHYHQSNAADLWRGEDAHNEHGQAAFDCQCNPEIQAKEDVNVLVVKVSILALPVAPGWMNL